MRFHEAHEAWFKTVCGAPEIVQLHSGVPHTWVRSHPSTSVLSPSNRHSAHHSTTPWNSCSRDPNPSPSQGPGMPGDPQLPAPSATCSRPANLVRVGNGRAFDTIYRTKVLSIRVLGVESGGIEKKTLHEKWRGEDHQGYGSRVVQPLQVCGVMALPHHSLLACKPDAAQ